MDERDRNDGEDVHLFSRLRRLSVFAVVRNFRGRNILGAKGQKGETSVIPTKDAYKAT